MTTETTDPDFELVDNASDRKSSTSESFETVDKEKVAESSSEETEGEDEQEENDNEEDEVSKNETVTGKPEEKQEEEEFKLPFVDQSIKDDAERPKEKDGEDLVEEMLNAPIRPDQEQFYTAEDSRRAITLLVFFSAMMFTLPLTVMFSLYYYVFLDYFHMDPAQAMVYAAICGAAVVILICALFAYTAWKEERDAERRLKESKKTK